MTCGLFCTVLDGFGLFFIVVVSSGLTCGLIFEIFLDLDAGRWLWLVLDDSRHLRIDVASFA